MFKTTLPPAALTCAEPNAAVRGLTRQGSEASSGSVRVFCALAALLLALIATLPGCGPGTGGTGVGPVSSFVMAPIFFSGAIPPAQPPAFTLGTTSNGSTSAAATCPVDCSVAAATLTLEGERVLLQGPCFNFVSQSPLAIAASGSALLAGSYQTISQTSTQTLNLQGGQTSTSSADVTLMIEFASRQADSPSVTISVRDSVGALLLGPAILLRVSVASGVSPVEPQTGGVLGCL